MPARVKRSIASSNAVRATFQSASASARTPELLAVIALSAAHGYFSASVRAFAEDRNTKDARHWRIMNEAPTVLMIVIVVMVVVKPW